MQTCAHGQLTLAQNLAHFQIVEFIHHHMILLRVIHVLPQIERHHAVIFVVAINSRTGRERQHLITLFNHAINHRCERLLVGLLRGAEALVERRQFTQRNCDSFLALDGVKPVIHRIIRYKTIVVMVHKPRGIHALLDFAAVDIALVHQFKADGFTQNQRLHIAEDITRQMIKLRVLEWPHAVPNHVNRLFRHKTAQRMLELRNTV
ncbi:hypothetical protein D3C75_696940 [compost metagenome]